jgi:hypothetical protein
MLFHAPFAWINHAGFRLREIWGAGGGNRTLMGQAPRDFESRASTSFTTPAFSLAPFYASARTVSSETHPLIAHG